MQNLVPHLPQFLDDAPLGFRRSLDIPACVLDNAQQPLHLGFQFRVFPQPFRSGHARIRDFSISEKRDSRPAPTAKASLEVLPWVLLEME
jgi:hypothetical protein